MQNEIILTTPYFNASSSARQRELDACLLNNAANEHIDKIYLLIDDDAAPPPSDKIEIIPLSSRPTYASWLEYAGGYFDKPNNAVLLLANSDIYFDDSIASIHRLLDAPETFMALTRWDALGDKFVRHPDPQWSQDAWAISTKSNVTGELIDRLRFKIGVPRCDNKVAYVFATAGWKIRNPCEFIKSIHLHESAERTYDKRRDTSIVGGVTYVFPNKSLDTDSELQFEIWTLGTHNVTDVSMNNSLERWRQDTGSTAVNTPLPDEDLPDADPRSQCVDKLDILKSGKKIFSAASRYVIYESDSAYLLVNGADTTRWKLLPRPDKRPMPRRALVRYLIPPVIDMHIDEIADAPRSDDDPNFWQFPCLTEKQASEVHLGTSNNFDVEQNVLNVYLPLPWATYIDRKSFPETLLEKLEREIRLINYVAGSFDLRLRVHTVCQHIHWRRALDAMQRVGVTDVALSHCEVNTDADIKLAGYAIDAHPWPLYAVNYADKSRSEGLTVGKPIADRQYLASFIGAHMPHYRSDVRARLCEELGALGLPDIFLDLGGEWHFNKIVYEQQVAGRRIAAEDIKCQEDATVRYNRVLSDSRFALCPEGAGPNTLRLWEAIAVGCIPVLFDSTLLFPAPIDKEMRELCLFWKENDYGQRFYEWLTSFSDEDLQTRSSNLRRLYQYTETLTCF